MRIPVIILAEDKSAVQQATVGKSLKQIIQDAAVGTKYLPDFLLAACDHIESYFGDKRAIRLNPIKVLKTVKSIDDAHHVSAQYNPNKCSITLRQNVGLRLFGAEVLTHEFGHHISDTWLNPDKAKEFGADPDKVVAIQAACAAEYVFTKAAVEKTLGEPLSTDVDEQFKQLWKVPGRTISGYALQNINEWYAEAFALFCNYDRNRLKTQFPAAYNALDCIVSGRIFSR